MQHVYLYFFWDDSLCSSSALLFWGMTDIQGCSCEGSVVAYVEDNQHWSTLIHSKQFSAQYTIYSSFFNIFTMKFATSSLILASAVIISAIVSFTWHDVLYLLTPKYNRRRLMLSQILYMALFLTSTYSLITRRVEPLLNFLLSVQLGTQLWNPSPWNLGGELH